MMKAYFVCLVVFTLFHCREVIAGPTVLTSIQGAIQVGFGEYGAYPFIKSINVSCRARNIPVEGSIELFENRSSVGKVKVPAQSNATVLSLRNIGSHKRIIFTCRLQIMNAGYTSYIVDDSVGFTLWSEKPPQPRCISSIGSSGTTRESLNLTCVAPLTDPPQRLTWNGLDAPSADLHIFENFAYISQYVNVSDIQNPQSNPPAEIQWTVFGDDGDILNDLFITNLNVSINQNVAGASTINLTGKAVPFLNIHTVLCIAHGRSFIRVGVAQREIPKSSTTSAVTKSTIDSSTTQLDDNGGVDDGNCGSKNSITFITVIAILLVIIFILAFMCVYLCYRLRVTNKARMHSDNNRQLDSVHRDNVGYETYVPPASAPSQYQNVKPVSTHNPP
ncbi:hypothetical protein BSL78_21710 [Apostichopus japonicus]|uniref:Ig-like domain-containing protein n=1 Tax=Stichopus japonicus TaxID=307972 RepID=A0A2G8K0C2_STIJA|nr:hypothetical protein BSL78_21710 [Apostichopus japonicus]